jgi:hypothetical protein
MKAHRSAIRGQGGQRWLTPSAMVEEGDVGERVEKEVRSRNISKECRKDMSDDGKRLCVVKL